MSVRFSIQCYPERIVAYNDPNHPRHAFPEDWDSGLHPRFDFERIQSSFERLIAKGYTVHAEPDPILHEDVAITVRNQNGDVVFEMEVRS